MKKLLHQLVCLLLVSLPFTVFAQEIEMADQFRADGKIYVVIIVFAIILTGLFIYLFLLDKKIGAIERDQKNIV